MSRERVQEILGNYYIYMYFCWRFLNIAFQWFYRLVYLFEYQHTYLFFLEFPILYNRL